MSRAKQVFRKRVERSDSALTDFSGACDILSNERRCLVLRQLARDGRERRLRDIVVEVAAGETGKTPEAVTYDERKRVRNSLAQHHLPRLASFDAIEYDRDRGTVAPGPELNRLARTLHRVTDDTSWTSRYRRLTGLSVVLLGALWLDLPPLAMLPDRAWATLIVVAFAALVALQYRGDGGSRGELLRRG